MSYINGSLADALAVAGVINPATTANTQRNTGAINVALFDALLFIFALGDMASETIDCGVESVDSDGTSNAADITGKQATQITAHASNNDNKQVVIAVNCQALLASGKQYVRGTMVTGGATGGPGSCIVLGINRYGPPSAVDLSSVVQVVK